MRENSRIRAGIRQAPCRGIAANHTGVTFPHGVPLLVRVRHARSPVSRHRKSIGITAARFLLDDTPDHPFHQAAASRAPVSRGKRWRILPRRTRPRPGETPGTRSPVPGLRSRRSSRSGPSRRPRPPRAFERGGRETGCTAPPKTHEALVRADARWSLFLSLQFLPFWLTPVQMQSMLLRILESTQDSTSSAASATFSRPRCPSRGYHRMKYSSL